MTAKHCRADDCAVGLVEGQDFYCTRHWLAIPSDVRASILAQARKGNLRELASMLDYATANLRQRGTTPADPVSAQAEGSIVARLEEIMDEERADKRDADTIKSLLDGREQYGHWTIKQRPLALRLADRYPESRQRGLPGIH